MKTSTAIGVVAAIIIVGGGLWYYSSKGGMPGPTDNAGINGSPNQGNLGQPDNGTPQQPGEVTNSYFIHVGANAQAGTYLVALNGMTLYKFTNDQPNVSTCTGQCLVNWPPFTAPTAEDATKNIAPGVRGTVGTITRPDGSIQVTYNGMPLYYYANDTVGETKGQGLNATWFVVAP